MKGFCPSFLTITPNPAPVTAEGADGKKKKKGRIPALTRELSDPMAKLDTRHGFGVHIMGIGGTGSVTVASTIANAARLEGKFAIGLDQTGLAQKGGAVISDIKISDEPFDGANKISDGAADLYLGFDILNATDQKNLDKCHPSRTVAVISTTQTPTGHMITNRHALFPALQPLQAGINKVTRSNDNVFLDGQALAEGLFGDSMATNLFMVGVAYQAGTLPLKASSLEAAIQQAGVAVEMGLAAFRWGRMAVVDLGFVKAEIDRVSGKKIQPSEALSVAAKSMIESVGATAEVERLLRIRVPELIAYQNNAYAKRYVSVIQRVLHTEKSTVNGQTGLTEAAARYLYKLMAYKDEYEVARLHADPEFLASLDNQFKHGYTINYHLAPPKFSKRDPRTSELIKQRFGGWMLSAFKWLKQFKGLRGTAFDPFGKTEERIQERKLIEDYISTLDLILQELNAENHSLAIALASVPDEIRGFGHVKEKSIAAAEKLREQRLASFRNVNHVARLSTV